MQTPWAKIYEEMNTIVKMMGEACPKSIHNAFEHARKMRRTETAQWLRAQERKVAREMKWMKG